MRPGGEIGNSGQADGDFEEKRVPTGFCGKHLFAAQTEKLKHYLGSAPPSLKTFAQVLIFGVFFRENPRHMLSSMCNAERGRAASEEIFPVSTGKGPTQRQPEAAAAFAKSRSRFSPPFPSPGVGCSALLQGAELPRHSLAAKLPGPLFPA